MFLVLFLAIVVPLCVYAAMPWLVTLLSGKKATQNTVLLLGCILYAVSWFVPSPLIHGVDTSFSTHFIGGGLFTGCIWLYLKQQLSWKASPLLELISLYALVSMLGVANELAELLLQEVGIHFANSSDTWWDLLANTAGAFAFWVGYRSLKAK